MRSNFAGAGPRQDNQNPNYLEIVNPQHLRGPFRLVVFDFDGTLSLLRGNWQGLMVPMMVEALAATATGESQGELTALVEEFVTQLTGQPTMRQIQELCNQVEKRGRPRPSADDYLAQYLEKLLARTRQRILDVQSGRTPVDAMLVPGSRPLLERLKEERMVLAIASGTELNDVQSESGVLDIEHYFGPRIFGPLNNSPEFSKELVLRQLMAEGGIGPEQVVAIGDGPAEILAVKAVGGLAIGVASDEVHQDGRVNRLKREHLLRSGADIIIADYADLQSTLALIGIR